MSLKFVENAVSDMRLIFFDSTAPNTLDGWAFRTTVCLIAIYRRRVITKDRESPFNFKSILQSLKLIWIIRLYS